MDDVEVYIEGGLNLLSKVTGKRGGTLSRYYCKLKLGSEEIQIKRNKVIFNRERCDRKFFKETAEFYYFLGYVVGDGSLGWKNKEHTCQELSIDSKDKDILDKFKLLIKPDSLITTRILKERLYYKFTLRDQYAINFLYRKGVRECKSLNGGIIEVNEIYVRDYLRGLLDSDGCITRKACRWLGHKDHMNQVAIFLERMGYVSKYENGHGRVLCVVVGVKNKMKNLIRELYYPGCIGIERKVRIANSILEMVD